MNKACLLIVFIIGIISVADAQNVPPAAPPAPAIVTPPPVVIVRRPIRTYRLGVDISTGLAWAGVPTNSTQNHVSPTGVQIPFTYGLFLDYSFARNYSLFFNLNDAFTGGSLLYDRAVDFKSFPNEKFAEGTKVTYKLQYIDLPVSLKLKTNEINYITYFVQIGGEPDVLISANANINTPGGVNDVNKGNIYKDVTPVNFSFLFAGGIEYRLTETNSLLFSGGFHNSIIDFTRNRSGDPLYDDSRTLLKRITISAGIVF